VSTSSARFKEKWFKMVLITEIAKIQFFIVSICRCENSCLWWITSIQDDIKKGTTCRIKHGGFIFLQEGILCDMNYKWIMLLLPIKCCLENITWNDKHSLKVLLLSIVHTPKTLFRENQLRESRVYIIILEIEAR